MSFQAPKPHSLVPTRERLQTLQYVDLTTFSDSSQSRDPSDSDDPFDPLDLVGLPCFTVPVAQSSPKREMLMNTDNLLESVNETSIGSGSFTGGIKKESEYGKRKEEFGKSPRKEGGLGICGPRKEGETGKSPRKEGETGKSPRKEGEPGKCAPKESESGKSGAKEESDFGKGAKITAASLDSAGVALTHTKRLLPNLVKLEPLETPVQPPQSILQAIPTSPFVKSEQSADKTERAPLSPLRPVGLSNPHKKSPQKTVLSPIKGSLQHSEEVHSPFKKPRFTHQISPTHQHAAVSPKIRSYFSQEQTRGFRTVAKKRPPTEHHFAYPAISLATQSGEKGDLADLSDLAETERKRVKPMLLSKEQQHVIDMALRGKSLFFTGSAGTGKSVLLREMIKALKQRYKPGEVSVTASTGLAGFHIGGVTLHNFAGIGISDGDADSTLKMVRRNRKAVARWKTTRVLIIDEISMIDGRLFDKLDYIARKIRRSNKPFGGIQVVLCGDFYQLPPVSKVDIGKDGTETKDSALFAFESVAWKQSITACIVLTEVFRQKGDNKFIDMLNDMRHGVVSTESEEAFLRLSRPLKSLDGISPTELYATRFEVDRANNSKLASLQGASMMYTAKDGGTLPDVAKEKFLRNFLAPPKLFLKENAQVMCIKNFDDTLVNGSVGKVIGFYDRDVYHGRKLMENNPDLSFSELVEELNKEKVASLLSKKLGKTVTSDDINEKEHGHMIRQSQEHLDNVFSFMKKDESELSQETSESLYESASGGDAQRAFEVNQQRKIDFINQLEQSSQGQKHPLVRFKCLDGVTTRDVLVEPERWEITDEATDEVLVYRVQLPLMLAWALSIHKSQGQTLSYVKVDLGRIFENGQAYVALSRAASRDGLQVINFRKQRVRSHQTVEDFYSTLLTTGQVHRKEADEFDAED